MTLQEEISTNRTNYPHSQLVSDLDVQHAYSQLLVELKQLLRKLYSKKLVFNFGEKVAIAQAADLVRTLAEWKQEDFTSLTLRNILVDAIVMAEKRQVGAGLVCIESLLGISDIPKERTRRRSVRADLDKVIRHFLGTGNLSIVATKAIEGGALNGSVRFSSSNNNDFLIETEMATKIHGNIHPLFEGKDIWFDSPTLISVDGLIESLGEIDYILQECASHKNNVIILARDFHPDVVHTLSANFKDKRLNVVPFAVRQWDDKPDSDPLVVCERLGINCVSREKGDVLATCSLEDFSTVKSAYISQRSVAIHGLDGSNVHTTIRIPKVSQALSGLIEDRIRITINAAVGVARHGVYCDNPTLSCSAYEIGTRTSEQLQALMSSLGGIITPHVVTDK